MIKHRNDNLTKEQEIALGYKVQAMTELKAKDGYDFNELTPEELETVIVGEQAMETLVSNYINLARNVAHKFHKKTGTKYPIDDLIQDAITALIEATQGYKPELNNKLGTFAYWGISKRVTSAINYQRLVRMPENKMGEYVEITKAQKAYHNLTPEEQDEYASELDYVYKNVKDIKKEEVDLVLENMQPQVSLNAEIYDGDGQLMDILEDESAEIEIKDVEALDEGLERIIRELTPFQRDLIAYEYEAFPPSMGYSDFLDKYEITDKKVKSETRKTITQMAKIARTKRIVVNLQ